MSRLSFRRLALLLGMIGAIVLVACAPQTTGPLFFRLVSGSENAPFEPIL